MINVITLIDLFQFQPIEIRIYSADTKECLFMGRACDCPREYTYEVVTHIEIPSKNLCDIHILGGAYRAK